ncbi:NAD(P)H-binding protein [Streptomyces sp. NPDC088785]|uniref:NAD(P)H-binding protein n=1 Tax=Streptomyces sp. NPDC088785 TaxID=3365897 RepID=UPI00382E5E6D
MLMFVLIGATGTVGRQVMDLLLRRGAEIAAVTRDPAARLPDGVRPVVGDPSRPDTLTDWPRRTGGVLLSPRAAGRATGELLALGAARGAERAVVLSSATVRHPAGHRRFVEEFKAVEEAVRLSGTPWTFLRCADFDANALAWAPQIRAGGVVRGAHPGATTSPLHERDIAEVAVRALTEDGLAGRAPVLTGPDPLDQRDKVRLIGAAVGRTLRFEDVSPARVRQTMLAQGLPEDVPDRLLGSLADHAVEAGPATRTVEQLLGHPARSFATWAVENAAAFAG